MCFLARLTLSYLLALHTVQVVAAAPDDCRLVAAGAQVLQSKALSADGKVSCATCHDPGKAFADGLATAKGLEVCGAACRRGVAVWVKIGHERIVTTNGL
jgi:cytochrome c peroxidase